MTEPTRPQTPTTPSGHPAARRIRGAQPPAATPPARDSRPVPRSAQRTAPQRPGNRPDARSDGQREFQRDARPDQRPDLRTAPRHDPRPDLRTDTRPDLRAAPRSDARPDLRQAPAAPRPHRPEHAAQHTHAQTAPPARRTRQRPPAIQVDSPTAVRLAKRVMEEAACSRAQAEQLIEGGRVRVNGKVVQDPPTRVEPHDRVEVQGTETAARLAPATLLLHKPSGLTTQAMLALLTESNHQPNDRSGLQLLKKHLSGLVCLTPLEPAASGLVVWSQHPGISRKLQEDASTIEHEALATVRGTVSPEALRILNASAVIDGRAMHSARASINQAQPDHTTLRFAFKGYYPGQVVQLCEHAGLELTALRRLRIGRLPLASLPEGKWRFLLGYERF